MSVHVCGGKPISVTQHKGLRLVVTFDLPVILPIKRIKGQIYECLLMLQTQWLHPACMTSAGARACKVNCEL